MATVLGSCNADPEATQLELRLAHHFAKMAFKVGQANDSQTADNTVIVDVVKNGNKTDSQPVPFDTVQSFDEDVTDGNSVKLFFHLDPAKCKNQAVTVVVQGLTVS
jgi:hypothetical protein